ncbi:hypothetical protein [Paenibacillus polymyxa]|nr:hypothetical protein [Paenibacillus polymyxa]MDN4106688.1 hypothetical protein [Paenibacillus polymyxa]
MVRKKNIKKTGGNLGEIFRHILDEKKRPLDRKVISGEMGELK